MVVEHEICHICFYDFDPSSSSSSSSREVERTKDSQVKPKKALSIHYIKYSL